MQIFMAHFIFSLYPSMVLYKTIGKVFHIGVGTLLLKDTCSIPLITPCIHWNLLASTIEIHLLLFLYIFFLLLLCLRLPFTLFLFLLSLILHLLLEVLWNFFIINIYLFIINTRSLVLVPTHLLLRYAASLFLFSAQSGFDIGLLLIYGPELKFECDFQINSHIYAHLQNSFVWGAVFSFSFLYISFTCVQCNSLSTDFLVIIKTHKICRIPFSVIVVYVYMLFTALLFHMRNLNSGECHVEITVNYKY